MTAPGQVLIVISVLACGIIYGTDVFSAIVLRPALGLVDDRTLVSTMGRVHDFADWRLRVPGIAGIGAAIAGTAVLALAGHLGATIAGTIAVAALASWLTIYARISAPSTPSSRPPLNEENFRLMPGCFSNAGTASSRPVPGCKCWPSWRCAPCSFTS